MSDTYEEFEERGWLSRLRAVSVPGALVLAVAGAILYFLHDTSGVKREAPPLPTLVATLPPPPPPPPPQKQPEVEKKVEEEQKPTEQPKQVEAPRPITINGPAQAGTDAFGVGAGSGGGEVGSGGGFGDATYSRYMGSALQQAIQNDERVNRLVFSADVAIWVNESGRITRAEILQSSGDAKVDQDLVATLEAMPALDEPPPSTLEFPQRITVRGRRAAG